jgi:hypothetical protein
VLDLPFGGRLGEIGGLHGEVADEQIEPAVDGAPRILGFDLSLRREKPPVDRCNPRVGRLDEFAPSLPTRGFDPEAVGDRSRIQALGID